MHGSHWCKFILSSLNLPPGPHMFSSLKFERKIYWSFPGSAHERSCSDSWDAENGLRLLLTEKSPDGKAESPLSAASTRLSSYTSLARVTAVSWIHQALVDHRVGSPLAWAFCWFLPVPPPPLSLSPLHNTYLSLYFSFLHLFSFINVCFAKTYKALL